MRVLEFTGSACRHVAPGWDSEPGGAGPREGPPTMVEVNAGSRWVGSVNVLEA